MNPGWPLRAHKVLLTPETFKAIFEEGRRFSSFLVLKGLPADASLEAVLYDRAQGHLIYVFSHPSWELVYSLDECPFLEVVYGMDATLV